MDRQLVGGEGKVLHGQYISSVDRQLVGGEGKVLLGQYISCVDRQLVGGEGKGLHGSTFFVWIDSLLVEKTLCYGC